jgi:hypothetical protein
MSDYFETKSNLDYPKNIRKIFKLMTINGKYSVIGSSSLKKIKYNADYDLQELLKKSKNIDVFLTHVYLLFLEKFKEAKSDPNIFITDFKCGEDKDGEPLRWTFEDMEKGYKVLKDGEKVAFQQALLMDATIKLDVISLINGYYTEFSDNYFFKSLPKREILKGIKESFEEYKAERNYMKMLKRSFSYKFLKSESQYQDQLIRMIDYFNSPVGKLYKAYSDLQIINLLLSKDNKFREPNIADIKNNLKTIRSALPKAYDGIELLNNAITEPTADMTRKFVEKSSDHLMKLINKLTEQFLKNGNLDLLL